MANIKDCIDETIQKQYYYINKSKERLVTVNGKRNNGMKIKIKMSRKVKWEEKNYMNTLGDKLRTINMRKPGHGYEVGT